MSIEKFNDVYGDSTPFEPKPHFVLTTDPSEHVALIDLSKYHELEWKKFLWGPPGISDSGYAMLDNKQGFKIDYLIKVFKVMNATEYAFELCDIVDDDVDQAYFLFLKDGNSCITILPRVAKDGTYWKVWDQCNIMDSLTKTASSVMII